MTRLRLHTKEDYWEAQFERHRFLTGFWVPKMVPKILQANLIFYVVFATGKPDGACREAESIQKSSPRRQQSGFNKTTRRVGRMLFLMETAHCATAEDTEQNGAKHFSTSKLSDKSKV